MTPKVKIITLHRVDFIEPIVKLVLHISAINAEISMTPKVKIITLHRVDFIGTAIFLHRHVSKFIWPYLNH